MGLMLVGLGGNNGSTCVAGVIANKLKMQWETKNGTKNANYWGSLTQASTSRLGGHGPYDADVYVPFKSLLPMVDPNDLVIGGWDISKTNLADAMKRAKVLDVTLQEQLRPPAQRAHRCCCRHSTNSTRRWGQRRSCLSGRRFTGARA